jgi:hypothetical protein
MVWEVKTVTNTTTNQRQIRSGVETSIVEDFSESRNDRIVSTNIAQTMRSRDITVTGENFKPNTRYYIFFDGLDVNSHMTPTATAYGIGGATSKGTGLRSDALGKVSATFTIPNTDELNFGTGTKTLKVTDSSDNSADSLSQGISQYEASGTINVVQEEIVSTRGARVVQTELSDSRMTTSVESSEDVRYVDPLAQSFVIDTRGGIFVTSVEVYFGAKDTALPATIQLRHMENGFPTQKILPFGEKVLYPASINTSSDASVSTKFTFPSPVFLENKREFCIVVMSNSNEYTCWVSEMGQRDITTNDFIDQQPYAGSLFKSQNNSTWTPDQMRDLKMTLNRASFTTGTAASVVFENATLSTDSLQNSPIEPIAGTKTFRVKHYSHGNYDQNKSNITIAGVVGDRTGSVFSFSDDTITGLSGLTADEQELAAVNVSSSGTGLKAKVTTTTTASTAIEITNVGQGYAASDTVKFEKDSVDINVTIAAIKETLGGIPIEYINTTHSAGTSASGSTSGAKIMSDIDEYLITIPDATWPARVDGTATTPNYGTDASPQMVENTSGGGESVTATQNAYFDIIHTAIPSIELPNTAITSTFKASSATAATYLASPTDSYAKDSSSTTITLNDNNQLITPKLVASGINESSEMGSAKSFEVLCQLSSTANNVSPVLDVDSLGAIMIQNRINKIDSTTDIEAGAYVSSTESKGDSNAAIYMTKKVQLENVANAIHIMFDGYKVPNATTDPSIDVYYKVAGTDTSSPFDELGWKLGTIKKAVQPDASGFREHLYEIEGLDDFNTFSIKMVLQSIDSANPPLVENFRAIALST